MSEQMNSKGHGTACLMTAGRRTRDWIKVKNFEALIEQPRSSFGRESLPKGTRHCQPRLVAEVEYLAGADSLRHAALRDVRVAEPSGEQLRTIRRST